MAREEFLSTTDARSKGPLITAAMGGIKIVLDQVRKIAADSDGEVTALNGLRQRELSLMVSEAFDDNLDWLVEKGVDREEARDRFHGSLLEAARRMDERQP